VPEPSGKYFRPAALVGLLLDVVALDEPRERSSRSSSLAVACCVRDAAFRLFALIEATLHRSPPASMRPFAVTWWKLAEPAACA